MNPFATVSWTRLLTLAACSLLPALAMSADAWVYSGRDFTGEYLRLSRSEAVFAIGSARSIRIADGLWDACTEPNFRGDCRRLTPGDYRDFGDRFGTAIRSLRHAGNVATDSGYAGARMQLFDRANFGGRSVTVQQDMANLDSQGMGFAAQAGSAIVSGGTWEVCTDYNFSGRCQALPPGQYADLGAQLNNRIVSVRVVDGGRPPVAQPMPPVLAPPVVPPNWGGGRARVDAFTGPNFSGMSMSIDRDIDNLRNSGFNDRIQSLRVYAGQWEACEDRDYGGNCMVFSPGDYARLPQQLNLAISSMRVVSGSGGGWGAGGVGGGNYVVMDAGAGRTAHPVWLYEDSDFGGRSLRAFGDLSDLSPTGMNDKTSSIIIASGTWQFCEDSNFRGRCITLGPGQYRDMPPGMNDVISSFRRVR
ncbi:MAG: beta/gamma crystallin family protein [Burkholderiales bacterium]|nr:beta/gamma crystallin family protein [Burkholderiales bacterium]